MRARRAWPAVELLDPTLEDPRLEAASEEPLAWAEGDVLTIAVRREGDAPLLAGTVHEPLRPAGPGLWAIRLRVPELEHACIEYRVAGEPAVWRGPKSRGPVAPALEALRLPEPAVLQESEVGRMHRVSFWSPPGPRALIACADGEGMSGWASLLAAAGDAVALVGVESAGVTPANGPYDRFADPRARAYLPHVDPAYFAAHMTYVVDTVVPWALAQTGEVRLYAFGASNGAAWAASAGALYPERFAGVLAFSLAEPPKRLPPAPPPHALVAGKLEPSFHRSTTAYARKLRRCGTRVRLRTPVRGHDYTMWLDEFLPSLRWLLDH